VASLPVIHHGIVYILALGCARLAILGHHAPCGRHELPVFFRLRLDGAVVDLLQAEVNSCVSGFPVWIPIGRRTTNSLHRHQGILVFCKNEL
jgi:hypothetical protein